MSSIKRDSKYISQILILATSSIIALAVLSICIWLYYSMKSEVESKVSQELDRSISLVTELTNLKRRELKQTANSLVEGPLLKGALASVHTETIEDVLKDITTINNLSFVAVIDGKTILYSNFEDEFRDENIKELTQKHIIGVAKLDGDNKRLIIGLKINHEFMITWEKISKSSIIVSDGAGKPIVFDPVLPEIPSLKIGDDLQHIAINDEEYYSKSKGFLNNTVYFHVLNPKKIFWVEFKKKRNSLIFLGVALFFLGILLSILTAYIIRPLIDNSSIDNPNDIVDIAGLIQEIEEVKSKLGVHGNT